MSEIMKTIEEFKGDCPCGVKHETAIRDVRVGRGLVNSVGEILKENNFPKKILFVTDKNALKASEGIVESLTGFDIEYKIYDDMRIARLADTEDIVKLIDGRDIAVLSVGSGSVNDPCRYATALANKPFCIFATAPSMDGFASYGAPLVNHEGFKYSYPAKSPEVIIGDTEILAAAPVHLKSAGFGDMISKYTALIDWRISSLLTGEMYCERVAALTRKAIDDLMNLADKVTVKDPETAGKIFESLLLTGIGMSFTQNSRPASGAEHIIAHLIDCKEIAEGKMPNFHGEDVGVCTLETLKIYNALAENKSVKAKREQIDWDDVFAHYGNMADDVRSLNTPDTITDSVDPKDIEGKWSEICEIIHSVPSFEECRAAMQKAGCKITVEDIGKKQAFFDECVKYSPYMRRRLTLLRMIDMIEV